MKKIVPVSVLLLFLLLFIGRINPARVAGVTGKDVSLIKSTLYFRSLTEDVVALDPAVWDADQNGDDGFKSSSGTGNGGVEVDPFTLNPEDFESYDDYYAALFSMTEESAALDSDSDYDYDYEDDDSEDEDYSYEADKSLKEIKIRVLSYNKVWKAFKEAHSEIAAALRMAWICGLVTVLGSLIALVGLYLSFGGGRLKKAGYICVSVGGLVAGCSSFMYPKAFNMLTLNMDVLEVGAVWPACRWVFFAAGALVLLSGILGFLCDEEGFEEGASEARIPPEPFQVTYRLLALLAFLLLFIPGANPARISEKISRNMSLFTSGFFYNIFTENMQLAFRRGWVPESIFRLVNVSALLTDIGIILCGGGACMSVGNNKLKRWGHLCLIPGSLLFGFAQIGFLHAYHQEVAFGNLERTKPMEPQAVVLYIVIAFIICMFAVISYIKTPKPAQGEKPHIDQSIQLFLMLLPFLILIFIFSYLPLWGWRYAFFDYAAGGQISMDNWVGFKWFAAPFTNEQTRKDIFRVLRNTLAMSGLGIATSWCPMFFAIFLAEIKNDKSRRVIQTLTTVPNFISWVLVYAIAFCIFGTEGFINNILVKVLHITDAGQNYLMSGDHIWFKMLMWGMWKGLGWSAIMYIAAISGIDQQLYEAATVDGAGRFQKMIHITLPELVPTFVVLLILSISNILSNGMDQYLVFKNPNNKNAIEVLDLYVYQLSLGQGSNTNNIPFSTVVSMFKSVVSVILLFVTNRISKWVRGTSIF